MPLLTNTAEATISGQSIIYDFDFQGVGRGEGLIAYIDAEFGGSESVTISIQFKESRLSSNYYQYSLINGVTLSPVIFNLDNTGKYRINIPNSHNEDSVKIVFTGTISASTISVDLGIDSYVK